MDELIIPYPDFQMGEVIDPEQHDLNNLYVQNKINEFVEFANELLGSGGAEKVQMKPVAPFTSTNIQGTLDELITRLQATGEGLSGSSLIASPALVKLAGTTVEAQLKALDAMLQTAYVISTSIADGAILTAKLADGSVTTIKLADNSIITAKLINGAVTNAKLGDFSITSEKIVDGSIITPKLASQSVSSSKIENEAVTSSKLAPESVITPKIAPNSITTGKIADGNVTTSKLADFSVTEFKLASNSVSNTKIVSASITSAKLADNSVTPTKILAQAIKAYHLDPTLLDALPNTLLTAKVLALETKTTQMEQDIIQTTATTTQLITAHTNDAFPHKTIDGSHKIGIGYNAELNCVQFIFREVNP